MRSWPRPAFWQVSRSDDPQELISVIRQVLGRELRRRKLQSTAAGEHQGRIITVHGAKGGVGAITICANLAVATRQATKKRVALVDGNLLGADQGVLLNLLSENSIGDLVPHIKSLDTDLLEAAMLTHESGVRVLLAPDPIDVLHVDSQGLVRRVIVDMRPNRVGPLVWRSSSVVELPAGTASASRTEVGDHLSFE